MLNIITSLSPDILADDMIKKVKSCWTDPFASPVIVFTDSKTEQWFRLHMLKRNAVLLNLHTARLESFLFNCLKTADRQSLLSPDLLRDVIIQKLLSTENEIPYLNKIKDEDNIANYLNITENTDNIDYKHLFDLANDLARLFIEYEATRKNIDDAIPDNNWQKDLYNAIMHDGISFNQKHYYTCPELAEKNKIQNNGKIVFDPGENQHIFIFGFSGMGQTYRNILKELGTQSDVYIYLQKAQGASNTNTFLKHWAQFGNTNHTLFDAQVQTTCIPESGCYNADTTLGKIQNSIAQDINIDVKDHDTSLTITSVPSKIKELEIVHSSICKLLQDKDKNVTLKDILVLAPDIDNYKSEIAAVFNQTNEDDKNYPFIPVSIVSAVGKNSFVANVLETLYLILHDCGFTRKTFFNFTKNFIIQTRYKISDTDVTDVFQKWIEKLRVYRVHKNSGADDWQNAVNSMLIAKLTDKTTCLSSGETMPFSDFNTEDQDADWLIKFVQIFYDIKNRWINDFKNKTLLSLSDIKNLRAFLNDLFALHDSSDSKLFWEGLIWDKVNRKLEQYIEHLGETDVQNNTIPMECALLSLIDIASNVKFNTGAVFTHGVTFTSLLYNRILPAKYVFLIGMSSDNFPGTNKKIVLDRRLRLPQKGDEDIPSRNKNAFLCQLMATSDELHLSFVRKDLQTDNTFYPSCVLTALTQHTGIKTRQIGIDEKRKWNELYTPREHRNKHVYIKLHGHIDKVVAPSQDNAATKPSDLPNSVKLKEFQYFIENPLKCYISRVFGFEENDTSTQELENIESSPLEQTLLRKRLIPHLVHAQETTMEKYKDILPSAPFDTPTFKEATLNLEQCIKGFNDFIKGKLGKELEIKPNYPINLSLKCNNKSYVLSGEILMCAYEEAGTDVFLYVENWTKRTPNELCALIAQIAVPGKTYTVYRYNSSKYNDIIKTTKEVAEDKLNEIYKQAFIEGNKKYIPFFENKINQVKSLEELRDNYLLNEYKFTVSHKKLLNPDVDLGFTKKNFVTEFNAALTKHALLVAMPEIQGIDNGRKN